ncbi:reverse transcriptase domain-containing protein [Tanacetum coccineum]|uniref:Reverse transcriptase domain-containing protein n=1 Tax=Tanacetum coccineum TaxID=301880 RepID=A0ABQ5J8U3_9ASTR
MPFGLCNAPATFQHCMMAIFLELIEDSIEICDKKGAKNLTVDNLSRLENPNLGKLTKAEIRDLFPHSYQSSVLIRIITKCVARDEGQAQILQQSHQTAHKGASCIATTARKVFEAGFYWPNIFRNARRLHGAFPFIKWKQIHPVAIDYVSKWVKAQAFPTNDAQNIVNFLKKLFARFRIPKALISDRGTYFRNYQMEQAMKRYGVIHRFSTAYHPQTNGQVKNKNRAIKHILEKAIRSNRKDWHAIFRSNLSTKPTGQLRTAKWARYDKVVQTVHTNYAVPREVKVEMVKPYQKDVLEADKHDDITLDDEGEVTKFLIKNEEEIFIVRGDGVGIKPDGVASPAM